MPQARFLTKMEELSTSSACASASPVSSSPAAPPSLPAPAAALPAPAALPAALPAPAAPGAGRGGGGEEKMPFGAHSRYSGTCW